MIARTPESILVPVDFGDASAGAVHAGGLLAAHYGATLQLLHAEPADAPAYFTHEQIQALVAQRRQMRDQADAYLARFGHRHTTHPFFTTLSDLPPVEAILQYAAQADLVVMGTHGRRGPSRWWLGSVTERVLREAGCPLLVVRAERADGALFQRPLVLTSKETDGAATLQYARAIAEPFGGGVIDGRQDPISSVPNHPDATLLIIARPRVTSHDWLAHIGDPLIRACALPILFVPDPLEMSPAAGRTHREGEPS
jgi:nucleotide-binding universal stress UspA family protein